MKNEHEHYGPGFITCQCGKKHRAPGPKTILILCGCGKHAWERPEKGLVQEYPEPATGDTFSVGADVALPNSDFTLPLPLPYVVDYQTACKRVAKGHRWDDENCNTEDPIRKAANFFKNIKASKR
jgi:hypothetical protein